MNKIDKLKKELKKNIRKEIKEVRQEYYFTADNKLWYTDEDRVLRYEIDSWIYKIEKTITFKKFFNPISLSEDIEYGLISNDDILTYYVFQIGKYSSVHLNNVYLLNEMNDTKILKNIKIGDWICKVKVYDIHDGEETSEFFTLSYLYKTMKKNIQYIENETVEGIA